MNKKVEILVGKQHFKWMAIQPARPGPTRPVPARPDRPKKGYKIDRFKDHLSKNAEFQKRTTRSTDFEVIRVKKSVNSIRRFRPCPTGQKEGH